MFAPKSSAFGLCRRRFLGALTLLAMSVWLVNPAFAAADNQTLTAASLRSRIGAGGPIFVHGLLLNRAALAAIYEARGFAPLWQNHPEWEPALTAALASAAADGLSPERLFPAQMRAALADPGLDAVERELLLCDRFLAYAAILARGQISPKSYWPDWALSSPQFDPGAAASSLDRLGGPTAVLQSLRPSSADYDGLQRAFAFYAGLASAGGWPILAPAAHLKIGANGPAVAALRKRLAAEGYLGSAQVENPHFDDELTRAVMLFQRRHGLADDGAVGPLTLAALNVSAAERAGQISVNLERWREMPRLWSRTRIEVNVPAQTLIYYRDGKAELRSRVIVGDPGHHTPVLAAALERVILDPAWNIPVSIIGKEIQPRLARDPGYLARTHTIILGRGAGDPYGRDVDWKRTQVLAMGWRLRQLPGAWNSLGSVVLDMPNPFDVYLHDTPVTSLFAQPRRALSHGCIRVEQVRALAALLLGLPELPPAGGDTRSIELAAPVGVYLLYQTAFIDQEGALEFRDDIYGRDKQLAELLAAAQESAPAAGQTVDTGCHGAIGGLASLNP